MRACLTFLARFLLAAGVLFGCWDLVAPVYLAMVAPLVNTLFRLTALPVQLELQGQALLLAYHLPGLALRLQVQDYSIVYLNLITALSLLAASSGRGSVWKIQWSVVAVLVLWATHVASFWITGHLAIWEYAHALAAGAARDRLLQVLGSGIVHPWWLLSASLAQWNIWGRYSLPVAVWFFAVRDDPLGAILEAARKREVDARASRDVWTISRFPQALIARGRYGGGRLSRQPGLLPLASLALLLVLVVGGCDNAPTVSLASPVADAGPDQQAEAGAEVILGGSASTTEDDQRLEYMWAQLEGPVPVPIADATTARARVRPLQPGVYVFRMTVTDAMGGADSDQVNILVVAGDPGADDGSDSAGDESPDPVNTPPRANSGPDFQAGTAQFFVLDGSASVDTDGDSLIYSWVQTGGPSVLPISGADAPRATTTAAEPGEYRFRLTVIDSHGQSSTDVLQVHVIDATGEEPVDGDGASEGGDAEGPGSAANVEPLAHAGGDSQVDPGDLVILDGRASFDPEGAPLTYAWSEVLGPQSLLIRDAHSALARVTPELSGTYVFRLTVSDTAGVTATDEVRVQVRSVATAGVLSLTAGPVPAAAVRVGYQITGNGMGELRGDMFITQDHMAQRSVLSVPAGTARVIEVTAYDRQGVALAYGVSVIDVKSMLDNASVSMEPLASGVGDIRVEVIFTDGDER